MKKPWLILSISFSFLFLGCTTEEQKQEYREGKLNTERGVSSWIIGQAYYPKSYKSISFSEFQPSFGASNGVKIPNSEDYVIKHTHNIRDKDSNLTEFTGYFILNNEFLVNSIELKRSNSRCCGFPPKTSVWLNKYGRDRNYKDTIEYNELELRVRREVILELKQAIEKGITDTARNNRLKKLIDTVESWDSQ